MDQAEKAAQEQLRDAINAVLIAKGWHEGRLITDYLVCVASQGFDENGDGVTQYNYIVPDLTISWHRAIGLIEVIRLLMKENLASDD